eukprot:5260632-Pleurochrysis_carterae.AAC.1
MAWRCCACRPRARDWARFCAEGGSMCAVSILTKAMHELDFVMECRLLPNANQACTSICCAS